MLFITDPDAYRAMIEDRRRDDGQRRADIADAEPPAPTDRPVKRPDPRRYRSAPMPSS